MSNATGDGGSSSSPFAEIDKVMKKVLLPLALEAHPFMVGWYNELVGPRFELKYPPTTVAIVIISGPDIFEKCVVPYLRSALASDPNIRTNDPLDDAVVHAFNLAKQRLDDLHLETDIIYDFELYPSRKPKILVQTAAHVAGAAQYFHKMKLPLNIQEEYFAKESDLCGVAVHPHYGGWFAIRGVIIFKGLEANEDKEWIRRREPLNLIPDETAVVSLLREFAYNWEEEKWRNVYKGPGPEYSENFKNFLATKPGERWEFLKEQGLLYDI